MTATVSDPAKGKRYAKDLRSRGFRFDTGTCVWTASDLSPMEAFGKVGWGTPRKGFLFSKEQLEEWGGTINA